jgi:hypothetical protein
VIYHALIYTHALYSCRRFDEAMGDLSLTLTNSLSLDAVNGNSSDPRSKRRLTDSGTAGADAASGATQAAGEKPREEKPWCPQDFTGGGMLTKAGRRPVCFQV